MTAIAISTQNWQIILLTGILEMLKLNKNDATGNVTGKAVILFSCPDS